jgi:hypothetical protein
MDFKRLLQRAKSGDIAAVNEITELYRPLLLKESVVNGVYDEDLYQELWLTLLNCIKKIKI